MDARKSAIFAFQLVKLILPTMTPDTINGFRDSVLVCKMHDCYCTIRKSFEAFPFLLISHSHRAMQAASDCNGRPAKPLQNAFKRKFTTIHTYSNCIVYRLFYCKKIN